MILLIFYSCWCPFFIYFFISLLHWYYAIDNRHFRQPRFLQHFIFRHYAAIYVTLLFIYHDYLIHYIDYFRWYCWLSLLLIFLWYWYFIDAIDILFHYVLLVRWHYYYYWCHFLRLSATDIIRLMILPDSIHTPVLVYIASLRLRHWELRATTIIITAIDCRPPQPYAAW